MVIPVFRQLRILIIPTFSRRTFQTCNGRIGLLGPLLPDVVGNGYLLPFLVRDWRIVRQDGLRTSRIHIPHPSSEWQVIFEGRPSPAYPRWNAAGPKRRSGKALHRRRRHVAFFRVRLELNDIPFHRFPEYVDMGKCLGFFFVIGLCPRFEIPRSRWRRQLPSALKLPLRRRTSQSRRRMQCHSRHRSFHSPPVPRVQSYRQHVRLH